MTDVDIIAKFMRNPVKDIYEVLEWNWLIQVISKARDDQAFPNATRLYREIELKLEGLNINSTYNAVLKFIKEHNKHRKE